MELHFGTAGIPVSTKPRDTIHGLDRVKELGLDGMEIEFVHSVNISEKSAPLVRDAARKNGLKLTTHGQYYMNLNSVDSAKIEATKERILKAARMANLCGSWSLCFHAAFYMGQPKETVYKTVRGHLKDVVSILKKEGNNIWIRPELTGKPTQFGDLDELIRLSQDLEQVMPCIDFSHYHARTGGNNSYKDFSKIFESIEKGIGKEALKNMHMHVAGIAYGEKGEKHHLNLEESDMDFKGLAKSLKDYRIGGMLISESPNIEGDALLMKNAVLKAK